ncbi:MAG TPA: carbohydrate ABC transporter permease [Herpetosiphonaceae bacterium]|nr:carbohydrate ABC transporter permease [Herpetosiphonaceae bacterium]
MAAVTQRSVQPTQTRLGFERPTRRSVIYHVCVGLFSVLMVYPLIWLIASSFKPRDEVFRRATALIPHNPTLSNYTEGWAGFGGVTFTTFYINSFIISGVGTIAAVISSAVVAYGFARLRFAGKSFWFTCMLLTLMLPAQVQIIPQYIIFSKLDWINTFRPLLVPRFFGQAFFIFMMIQFIRGIPYALDEAAEIDGAGKFGIFWRIILPLLTPALITSAVFSFYWTWDDFFGPLLYLSDPRRLTVALALKNFADASGGTNWGAIFAMSVLSLVPVFGLFLLFQRYIVEGISTSGLKG